MAGSYDPAFHRAGSSSSIASSPALNSGQYKANVNRTKTRKWVEAKTIDYGGDDWGGDYDNEPAEEAEETPQGAETTASRFATAPPTSSTAEPQHTALTAPRPLQTSSLRFNRGIPPSVSPSAGARTPGPPLHIQTQQNSPATHQTQTPTDASSPWTSDPHSRRGTPVIDIPVFERSFGAPRILAASPNRESIPPRFPHRKSSLSQADLPDTESFATPLGGPTPFGEGPQLGAAVRPSMGSGTESSQTSVATVTAPNKPESDSDLERTRSASPGVGNVKSPASRDKPLPFVRPADIYRKVAEEKVRVRRSQDSGRPSMDSIRKGSDIESPTKVQNISGPQAAQSQIQPESTNSQTDNALSGLECEKLSSPQAEGAKSETAGEKLTEPMETRDETNNSARPRPSLATVPERKSEYGIEGLIASYERRGGTPTTPTFDPYLLAAKGLPPASPDVAPAVPEKDTKYKAGPKIHEEKNGLNFAESAHFSHHAQGAGTSTVQEEKERPEDELMRLQEELRRLSTSPKLPELGRLSGFGLDLFDPSSAPSNSGGSPLNSSACPPAPLSGVTETRSSVSSDRNDGGLVEAVEGQVPGKSGPILNSDPTSDASEANTSPTRPANTDNVVTQTNHPPFSDRYPDRQPVAFSATESSDLSTQEWNAHEENLSVLQNSSGQQSKSEHELSGGSVSSAAEPVAAPSGDSLVTQPGSQASQLVISGPILSAGTPGVSGSPTYYDDPSGKLAVPEELQQAKESYSSPNKVSAGEAENASQPDDDPSGPTPGGGAAHLEVTRGNDQNPAQVNQGKEIVSEHHHPVSEPTLPQNRNGIPSPQFLNEDDKRASESSTSPKADNVENTSHPGASQKTIKAPGGQPVTLAPDGEPLQPSFVTSRMVSFPISEAGSTTSLKDTDKLSEEILRSFTAAGSLDNVERAADADNGANHKLGSPSGARESSFLPDLYDDYWSFAGSGVAGASEEQQKVPDLPHYTPSVTIPEALKVKAEDSLPNSALFAKDGPAPVMSTSRDTDIRAPVVEDTSPPHTTTSIPEVQRPNISTRFSWEATPPVEPKSFTGQQQQPTPRLESFVDRTHELPLQPAHSGSSTTALQPEYTAGVEENAVRRNNAEDPSYDGGNDKIPVVDEQWREMNNEHLSSGPLSSSISADSTQPSLASPGTTSAGSQSYASAPLQRGTTAGGPQLNSPLDSHQIKSFSEIISNPSQLERIQQFNEARQHYAATGVGLETVLEHLAPMHPDILVQAGRGLGGASQPYAQQLSRNTALDHGAIPSPAPQASVRSHVPPHVHAAASQVSTRTKELTKDFLHGAGKASRGFFSTLKSKSSKKVPN